MYSRCLVCRAPFPETGRLKNLRSNDVVDLGGFRLTIEVGVPVASTMSARLTTEFAQQMLREDVGPHAPPEVEARLLAVMEAEDQCVDLLPLPKDRVSENPPQTEPEPPRPRGPKTLSEPPAAQPTRFGRSELAVYGLAALLVATSAFAMALLIHA